MAKEDFFKKQQKDLTKIKLFIYEKYIETYLIKILMQFGECFLGDLFCGAGKNGKNNGSPLVLIKKVKDILQNKKLLEKYFLPKIQILFNDNNKENIDNLKKELKEIDIPKNIQVLDITCKDFGDEISEYKNMLKDIRHPKFFFLDPFGYSDIHIADIKKLMNIGNYTEIIMFSPTSHIYRFIKSNNAKIKQFLSEFTLEGYKNNKDIFDFNESIRKKLMQYLNLKYVKPIILKDGANIHSLFFLTKHTLGMNIMNNLFWNFTEDGETIEVSKNLNQKNLFQVEHLTKFYGKFSDKLEKYFHEKILITNVEIIEFTVREGAKLRFALDILKELKVNDKIKIKYFLRNKNKGFYISEQNWNKRLCEIEYIVE